MLAHLVSPGSRGLFQRAIIQSGSFALNQQSLADAEAAGEAFAAKAGCPDQTAAVPAPPAGATVLAEQDPRATIPGVVDGRVLTEPIGTALAAGRFARVPILNGTNHDEERIFVTFGRAISGGTNVTIPGEPVTADSYQGDIASVLGVPAARAAAIAAEYPLAAYPSPTVAFSALAGDANFACPALQMDRWTSGRVPTFAYEFNDDAAPLRFTPPLAGPPVATHGSELQYLFDLPNAPVPGTLKRRPAGARGQHARGLGELRGHAATQRLRPCPGPHSARDRTSVLSLVPPQPQLETDFAASHHCAFWAAR